jgi:hypothetical protein
MAEFALAFALGAIAWWALTKLMRAAAFGGSRIGSDARQRWLARMDYETLLRTRKQIDDEIGRRQP